MREPPPKPFDPGIPRTRAWIIPAVSTMIGSLLTIVPVIATLPLMPPFGLMILLGWRLRRSDSLPIWAPLLLGLFDDLLSGQPLGNAMLLWTLCFFAIEIVEQRLGFRDFWQDWLIATGGIGFALIVGRLVASPIGAHVDTMLLLQIVIAAMFFPLIALLCARLDRRRIQA